MTAHDYQKEPWKHPACWKAHMVHTTLGHVASRDIAMTSCQCGWAVVTRLDVNAARAMVARTEAAFDHWRCVIAEAEAEAVPA